MTHEKQVLLEIRNLKVNFHTYRGVVQAVDIDRLVIFRGETLGLVGETGSGKSVTALSIIRLISRQGIIESGEILFNGQDLLKKSENEIRKIRGKAISVVFQDPMSSLNPVFTVGEQLVSVIRIHQDVEEKGARQRAISMLELVRLPEPRKIMRAYPHQTSAGMRQRAMIAMALSCNPDLLIADESTSALDVTIQAQILHLLRRLKERINASILMITHDLSVVAQNCDRVAVMYAGNIVEVADVHQIFRNPRHPYTVGLMDSVPRMRERGRPLTGIEGNIPDMINPPRGCRFHPRCSFRMELCEKGNPPMTVTGEGQSVRCFLYGGT